MAKQCPFNIHEIKVGVYRVYILLDDGVVEEYTNTDMLKVFLYGELRYHGHEPLHFLNNEKVYEGLIDELERRK